MKLTPNSTRTTEQHVDDFVRAASTPHTKTVAVEIERLRARVDELLAKNNEYLEDARAARREVIELRSTIDAVARERTDLARAARTAHDAWFAENKPCGEFVHYALSVLRTLCERALSDRARP